jgi:hypothetical protein
MRWAVIALAMLCACDKLLGLHEAAVADGPPGSAPPKCPAIATPPTPPTPPPYLPDSHQISTIACRSYIPSTSAGMATALCDFGSNPDAIGYGPIDADLAPLSFPPHQLGEAYSQALLTPEGDELWLHTTPPNLLTAMYQIDIYALAGGVATYSRTVALPPGFPINANFSVGAPALGRRFVYTDASVGTPTLHELIEDGTGVATEVPGSFQSFTGGFVVGPANLSRDGLRVILQAYPAGSNNEQLLYSERPTTNDPFAAPVALVGVPGTYDNPYMRNDCGRIYFDAAGFVFYLREAT